MSQFTAIQGLLHMCWPEMVEIDTAIFIAAALPSTGPHMQSFADRTAAEAFYNHIHLFDMLPPNCFATEAEHASSGTSFSASTATSIDAIAHMVVDMWRTKLQRDFPGRRVRLYLTYEDEAILRFHVVRHDEPAWLDPVDWQEQLASGRLSIYDTDE